MKATVLVLAIVWLAVPFHGQARAAAGDAQPVEKMIEQLKVVAELVKQLDDVKFEVRQVASERLIRIGQPAIEPLKRVLEGSPSLEMATRIEGVLKGIRKEHSSATKLRRKLAEPVTLETGFDANTPLKDALEFFSEKFEITIVVDDEAFEAIGVAKVDEQGVRLPKLTNVPLRQVLQLLLGQLKGEEYRGTFLIREDLIEVTTTRHTNPALWVGAARQGVPAVSCDFDREPLGEALRQLSGSTGINLVLDPRAAEKGRKTVSAAFDNVPLDTAVGLLADMANLKVVALDNVLYVTSRENAKELEAEKEKRAAKSEKSDNPLNPAPKKTDDHPNE